MKQAAIGVRMHSGWGALVGVCGNACEPDVIDRRLIVVIDPGNPGSKQPYHYAANLRLSDAQRYLVECAAASARLALAAIRDVIGELHDRHCQIAGCALLMAANRQLPTLSGILASHALIHTAEGEFFRKAIREACEQLGIAVTGFRERELEDQCEEVLGRAANRAQRRISALGKSLGPPWTKDHKAAALAATMVLVEKTGSIPPNAVPRSAQLQTRG
jgi:hypothetical protein